MDYLQELKLILREKDMPFFTDEELQYFYNKYNNDIKKTAYYCLIAKSEDTTLQISGLSLADTSEYFLRLASQYRPSNSGVLKNG